MTSTEIIKQINNIKKELNKLLFLIKTDYDVKEKFTIENQKFPKWWSL